MADQAPADGRARAVKRVMPAYQNTITFGQLLTIVPVFGMIAGIIWWGKGLDERVTVADRERARLEKSMDESAHRLAVMIEQVKATVVLHGKGPPHLEAVERLSRLEGEVHQGFLRLTNWMQELQTENRERAAEFRAELREIRSALGTKEDRFQPRMK